MEYTTEDYLCEMSKPLLALKLISTFLDDYILDNVVSVLHETQFEKDENISAIIYVMTLLQDEIKKHRNSCYKSLYENNATL